MRTRSRTLAPASWDFPLPRTHTGIPFGNGRFGALLWGEGRTLRVTLGRADFWDHRGGMPWTEQQSFANIRGALEAKDEARLRALFETAGGATPGTPRRPTVLPVGVVEFDLGEGQCLDSAALDLATGLGQVRVRRGARTSLISVLCDLRRGALVLRWPKGLRPVVRGIPAWEHVGEQLARISFAPPIRFGDAREGGWVQCCPADPALAAGWSCGDTETVVATARGGDERAAKAALRGLLRRVAKDHYEGVRAATLPWWRAYWNDVPTVDIPNQRLRFLHDFGMYKFAGLTHPEGVAATLQGPWIEEYQLPPWSSDYHFNINVQMCYWPAYRGNRLGHLRPLFELIRSWWPALRHNAKVFLGIDDGFMLPHAVDDRCVCMGGFWTGSVDHGCTAWVAEMMFRYVRYSGDLAFLRSDAMPFMKGAMRVYEAMLEEREGRLSLPVSVSPEYRGAAMNAWGRDASFQLACAHRLAEDLVEASRLLGEPPAAAWNDLLRRLPKVTLAGPEDRAMVALWEGTVLEESHRHHSHLAALVPFDQIDPEDPVWRPVVERSIAHWIAKGAGMWSGWCVPWASMLHTRMGNADAAELWLEIWERVFTNEGHGTLHDVQFPGFSLMGKGATCSATTKKEIMQMDAGMSCVAAIHEMLVHEIRGVHHVLRGVPASWRDLRFASIRCAGGFLVGATRVHGRLTEVTLDATVAGTFRLASPWPGRPVRVTIGKRKTVRENAVLEIDLPRGGSAVLRPAD